MGDANNDPRDTASRVTFETLERPFRLPYVQQVRQTGVRRF